MNKIVYTLLVFCGLLSGTVNAQVFERVNATRFKELVDQGNAIILDVRTPAEYSRGHIKGSTLIDVSDPNFKSKVSLVQKDKTVLLYCLSGSRSRAATSFLQTQGFKKIYELAHGLIEWNQLSYPLEKSTEAVAGNSKKYDDQIFSKLLKDNKLVFIDFQAVWCAPCKEMNPVIDKLASNYRAKVKVEKIDIEANQEITAKYKVQTIPGFLLFKEGKLAWSHSGTMSYEELEKEIKAFL